MSHSQLFKMLANVKLDQKLDWMEERNRKLKEDKDLNLENYNIILNELIKGEKELISFSPENLVHMLHFWAEHQMMKEFKDLTKVIKDNKLIEIAQKAIRQYYSTPSIRQILYLDQYWEILTN